MAIDPKQQKLPDPGISREEQRRQQAEQDRQNQQNKSQQSQNQVAQTIDFTGIDPQDTALREQIFRTLYNRGSGNYVADAHRIITDYVTSLSPQQQLDRARKLVEAAGGQDIRTFLNGRYQGIATAIDLQNIGAYKAFKDQIGRDPETNEFSQILPVYRQDPTLANAWLAQYAEQEKLKPSNLVRRAPEYADQINSVFQSMLGRSATQDEINHFGSQLASGNVDTYQLQDFLRGTPEYQTQQDTKFRSGLAGELQGYDTKFLQRGTEDILNRYAQTGGLQNQSSALNFAMADLAGKIAEQRGQYLAGLSAQQYGGNKELALQNYGNTMNQFLGNQQNQLGRSQQLQDFYQGRSNELTDYARQRQDYMDMLNSQQRGGGMNWGALAGGALGAGIGGLAGGPMGANAGFNIGSGIGGGYDQYRYYR